VDDNADLRAIIVAALEAYGAQVSNAQDGESGFATYIAERPDILVADLCMPRGGGVDLVRRVRELAFEEGGWVPAIAMSAAGDPRTAADAGFDVFVSKPFDCDDLAVIIAEVCRLRRSRDG
jgi:CheY-like chemotaxis protein